MSMRNHAVAEPIEDQGPLVSVLVPSYNHEDFVIDCLDSIKNLRYRRLELLVSDDCSRDSTFALVQQWAETNADRFERTLIVRQGNNLGIVGNMKFLFSHAKGAYTVHIASDDVFLESAISDRVKLLENAPDIDGVFANAELISRTGDILKTEFIPKRFVRQLSSETLLLPSLLLNWCVPGPVMMLRRTATLESGSLGILPDDLDGEDAYIYIRLATQGRLMFTSATVAKWRYVSGSASHPTNKTLFTHKYVLATLKRVRPAVRGFNRVALETKIAVLETELRKKGRIAYLMKKSLFRLLAIQLRVILDIRTALHSWHVAGRRIRTGYRS